LPVTNAPALYAKAVQSLREAHAKQHCSGAEIFSLVNRAPRMSAPVRSVKPSAHAKLPGTAGTSEMVAAHTSASPAPTTAAEQGLHADDPSAAYAPRGHGWRWDDPSGHA
jgi:hypothetical protein